MKSLTKECIEWTRNFVNAFNPNSKVVIGISGGKDSSCVAAILCNAIGKDRVYAVQLPNGIQSDISDSDKVFKILDLEKHTVNIGNAFSELSRAILNDNLTLNDGYNTNTPARLRMTVLFGISNIIGNALVVNTCNLSEDVVGYATLFGDSCGCFSPISKLTTDEVIDIGLDLGLPDELMHKIPTDGMSTNSDGSLTSDEEKLGFTYNEVNQLIRFNKKGEHFDKIIEMYKKNKFKTEIIRIPSFDPKLNNYFYKYN